VGPTFDWGDLVGSYGWAALPLALLLSGLCVLAWVVRALWRALDAERERSAKLMADTLPALTESNRLHRESTLVLERVASQQILSPEEAVRVRLALERVERRLGDGR
jgi:hypothetical protein